MAQKIGGHGAKDLGGKAQKIGRVGRKRFGGQGAKVWWVFGQKLCGEVRKSFGWELRKRLVGRVQRVGGVVGES